MSSEKAAHPGTQQSDSARETTKPARRVLIVDDNEDGARMLATLLELDGYEVLTSLSGSDAVETASSRPLDVVLLDIGLPGMDGYEVARRITAALGDRAPHLVAVTGYGREEDRERARSAGFAAHLVKPIDFQALRRIIAALE